MGQLYEIPFATGIDQRTRPEYVDGAQAWISLENVRVPKYGGADKRKGFSVYDGGTRTSGSRTSGDRLAMDGLSHVAVDGSTLDAYSNVYGVSASHGRIPEADMRTVDLPTPTRTARAEDVAYANGLLCAVTVAQATSSYNKTLIATVVDSQTGAIVSGPTIIATNVDGAAPVCSYGVYFLIVKTEVSTNTVSVVYLDTTSTTTINLGWQAAGGSVTTSWNAASPTASIAACSMTDRIVVAYTLGSGTDRMGVKTWNIAGLVEATTINTASTTPGGIDVTVGPLADRLWCAWTQGSAVKVIGLNPQAITSVTSTASTVITTSSASPSRPYVVSSDSVSGAGRLAVNDLNGSGDFFMRARSFTTVLGAVSATGSGVTYQSAFALNRPTIRNGRYYLPVVYPSSAGFNGFFVDFTDDNNWLRPVVALEPALGTLTAFAYSKVVTGASSTKLYMAMSVLRSSVSYAAQLVEFDFASVKRWQPAVYSNSLYLSGGVVGYFDGQRFNEASFLYRPMQPTTTTTGTGITLSVGARYVAVFEAVDADGNLVVSGVSIPSAVVTASNKTIVVRTQACSMSYRLESSLTLTPVRVVLYRTTDNGGTPPYYRLAELDNDLSSTAITYNDTTSDATLTTAQKLYTQPGIPGAAQDRRPPPALHTIINYGGMLVGCIGRVIWYSGQPVIGEAAWFNPIFQVPIDDDGDITALWVQDGTLFAAKRRGIWAISGEPPSDNAGSGGLGTPRKLASDVGCISQRSVVTTSLGTFFQSERGIELFTRAQAVEWVGENIQDELEARPNVMAATVDESESVVYFELASSVSNGRVVGIGSGGSGSALVFDLSLKKWISFDRRTNASGFANAPAQSACMLYDATTATYRYAWMDESGQVYRQSATSYLDSSYWVTKAGESAWAKPAVQGQMQLHAVRLLGKYATDSNQSIQLAYDYATSFQSARTWTRAEIAALTSGTGGAGTMPNVQLQHDGNDDAGRCMAVRAKFYDATPTGGTVGTGQGTVWNNASFEFTPIEGGYLLPDGAR